MITEKKSMYPLEMTAKGAEASLSCSETSLPTSVVTLTHVQHPLQLTASKGNTTS